MLVFVCSTDLGHDGWDIVQFLRSNPSNLFSFAFVLLYDC